jgi:single stranded DNA-binding protein (ssb)
MTDLIAITGNITSTPERRKSTGATIATFGLASTERRLEDGTWVDVHTNFYNVAVFRQLAENVLHSLEKGQRVIVTGRVRVRHWESNGRTGTSVDIEASSVGPDLMFGTAVFTRTAGARASAPTSSREEEQEWAPSAQSDAPPAPQGAVRDESRGLVAAGHWGEPPSEETTPF